MVVVENDDTEADVEKKRLALALRDPEGKWVSRNDKIVTERFIDKWRNEITVNGRATFRMINSSGTRFKGTRQPPIRPAAPPQPSSPPADQQGLEN